ncbi:type II toxin-antitoxin system VapC family toxin [Aquiluna sp. KACHI24]|uniref:type II toxin-antitoxin system VapC family toxin n=1 Tax=Aquiluna sp. KACHI24 TaxID=2968831 RepID=UPI00220FD099|nr:type II toxin-antitoxin system VapC family toxin [Aquiluna sp. KACHI24]BDQ00988.1 hypothetical protein AKACHI_13240 [Aquiluna sp. KACHI24]
MILLDSNAFYWFVTGQDEFGKRARSLIANSPKVYVSALSVLELTVKRQLAKLPNLDFSEAIVASDLLELPLQVSDLSSVNDFPALDRHDPIDRALLSQARANRLVFMTSDPKLLGLSFNWVANVGE